MGAKVKAHGKPKVDVSYYVLQDVLGTDWQIEATDPHPDILSYIPVLTGVYVKGRSANILPVLAWNFISLLCDRFNLQYTYPSGEKGYKDWKRIVRAATKKPKYE